MPHVAYFLNAVSALVFVRGMIYETKERYLIGETQRGRSFSLDTKRSSAPRGILAMEEEITPEPGDRGQSKNSEHAEARATLTYNSFPIYPPMSGDQL